MRLIPFVLLVVGCGPLGGDSGLGNPSGANCFQSTWEPLYAGGMTITAMQLNTSSYFPTYEHGKSYPGRGVAGCFDPNGSAMRWIFEAEGEPLGALWAEVTSSGNQDLQGSTASFTFEFFGDSPTTIGDTGTSVSYGTTDALYFDNNEFLTGAWVVDTVNPLAFTIQGQVQGPNNLQVNLAAEGSR